MDKRWTTDGVTTEEKGRETVLSGVSEDLFTGNNLLTIYFPNKSHKRAFQILVSFIQGLK